MHNEHKTISTIPITNIPGSTTYQLWVPEQDIEWAWNHEHHFSHQHARLNNSPSMSSRTGCESTWNYKYNSIEQYVKMQDSPTECQSRVQNGHEYMSIISVTDMPECTTHPLCASEQNTEWTWNHKHYSSHQHARMNNLPSMSAKVECRMGMKSWASFQSPICQNVQLTNYEFQTKK